MYIPESNEDLGQRFEASALDHSELLIISTRTIYVTSAVPGTVNLALKLLFRGYNAQSINLLDEAFGKVSSLARHQNCISCKLWGLNLSKWVHIWSFDSREMAN